MSIFNFMMTFFLKGLFIGVFVVLCVRVNQNVDQNVVNFNAQYRIIRRRDDQVHCIIQELHVAQIGQVCDDRFVYHNEPPILVLTHFMNQDYHMLFRTPI